MNIKILYHIMPWEIDYALLTFTQLKKSKYYLQDDVNITINSVLNLSSYLIDWEKSEISKDFFIKKYNYLSNLLIDYNHINEVYDGNQLYGHLDLQKNSIDPIIDYYMYINPDIYFSEYLLTYMFESIKQIPNKYFVVTPQISKFWDNSWDIITNPLYLNRKNEDWNKTDIFDIIHNNQSSDKEVTFSPLPTTKFAGWCDIYNKAFFEELCPTLPEWSGYGGWDTYSLTISNYVKQLGTDIQQYIIQGETVFEYSVGPLYGKNRDGFTSYYKDMLVLKDSNANNQRQNFDDNINKYINITLSNLKEKKVI